MTCSLSSPSSTQLWTLRNVSTMSALLAGAIAYSTGGSNTPMRTLSNTAAFEFSFFMNIMP